MMVLRVCILFLLGWVANDCCNFLLLLSSLFYEQLSVSMLLVFLSFVLLLLLLCLSFLT